MPDPQPDNEALHASDGPPRAMMGADHLCLSCGYNLRGTDGIRCPECGATFRYLSSEDWKRESGIDWQLIWWLVRNIYWHPRAAWCWGWSLATHARTCAATGKLSSVAAGLIVGAYLVLGILFDWFKGVGHPEHLVVGAIILGGVAGAGTTIAAAAITRGYASLAMWWLADTKRDRCRTLIPSGKEHEESRRLWLEHETAVGGYAGLALVGCASLWIVPTTALLVAGAQALRSARAGGRQVLDVPLYLTSHPLALLPLLGLLACCLAWTACLRRGIAVFTDGWQPSMNMRLALCNPFLYVAAGWLAVSLWM